VLEEGHRLLTFVVAEDARVSLVSKGLRPVRVGVPELAEIIAGRNPRHRALFIPGNSLGFWIRVGDKYPNPVLSLDQQYSP
jgi:hypothetical protein